jgi:hypothetical protein
MGTGVFFPGGKAGEFDHSPSNSTEVKNSGCIYYTISHRGDGEVKLFLHYAMKVYGRMVV